MTSRLLLASFAAAILVSLNAGAQNTDPFRPSPHLPIGDQLLSLPSPYIASQGTWEVKFSHRFNQSLTQGSFSDQLHALFGLDTNADVTFGLAYALRPHVQLSIARSNTNDTLEAAAKYVVLQQAPRVPLNITVRGGADIRTESDLGDRTSVFAQALLSRRLGPKVEVFAIPTFATNAGRAASADSSGALFDTAFNVPLGVAYYIRSPLAVVAEVIPPNQDLPDGTNAELGWSLGIKRNIGGHWFEILVTNSQSTMVDQYVTSTFQGAPLDSGDIKLGFNIERRFGRRGR
jgi:hypothetical protein